ncbi:MAG: HAD-IA family hydrolase [Burkholderiaceae bacterium]|nr:HAD-IA family hydrolase [Burkholderiaceae bacterium]
MEGRIAGVIFDFEGTLVDFQWRLAEAEAQLRAAFAALGYGTAGNYAQLWNAAVNVATDAATTVVARDATTDGMDEATTQGRLATLRDTVRPIYDRWDADALTRWAPRSGAYVLLHSLADSGVRAALVSNIGRCALAQALVRFGFDRRLAPIVSRDDVNFMKPHGEGIRRVLQAWRLAPQRALFVGDSRADVLAARAAGVRVAVVQGGECEAAEFDASPPDYLVSALDEVPALAGASIDPRCRPQQDLPRD